MDSAMDQLIFQLMKTRLPNTINDTQKGAFSPHMHVNIRPKTAASGEIISTNKFDKMHIAVLSFHYLLIALPEIRRL